MTDIAAYEALRLAERVAAKYPDWMERDETQNALVHLAEHVAALELTLWDIYMQATRQNRASGLKRYLVTDLEIIACKAEQALKSEADA